MQSWGDGLISAACRCASTSIARSCRHAASYSITTFEKSNRVAKRKTVRQLGSPGNWFKPKRKSWEEWVKESRNGDAASPMGESTYSKKLDILKSRLPQSQQSIFDVKVDRLAKYRLFKSVGDDILSATQRQIVEDLIQEAKAAKMSELNSLLEKMSQDDPLWTTARSSGPEVEEQRTINTSKVRPAGLTEVHSALSVLDLNNPLKARLIRRKEKLKAAGKTNTTREGTLILSNPRQIMEDVLKVYQLHSIRDQRLPEALIDETPSLDNESRLEVLWDTLIRIDVSFLETEKDLEMSLLFLHHIIGTAPPKDDYQGAMQTSATQDTSLSILPITFGSTPPYLNLAVKVLNDLMVETDLPTRLPEAPMSSGNEEERRSAVQAYLLRALIQTSLEAQQTQVAVIAFRSLVTLQDSPFSPKLDQETILSDLRLLQSTLLAVCAFLKIQRGAIFLPKHIPSPASPFITAYSLIVDVLRKRTGPCLDKDSTITDLSAMNTRILDLFAVEAEARNRVDMIADMWKHWRKKGWNADRYWFILALWFSGGAKEATYEVLNLDRQENGRTVRPFQVAKFRSIVDIVTADVLKDKNSTVFQWGPWLKAKWIEMLCGGIGANLSTRLSAETCYKAFKAAAPPGSRNPFVLSGKATATLVRSSTMHQNDPQERRSFARGIVRDLIGHISSDGSPYGHPLIEVKKAKDEFRRWRIPHYDLSTLASCFASLNDDSSLKEVYGRLLRQKMLPDKRDLSIVLFNAANRDEDSVLELIKMARSFGIIMSEDLFQDILRNTLGRYSNAPNDTDAEIPLNRGKAQSRKGPSINTIHYHADHEKWLKKILRVAEECGLSEKEVFSLQRSAWSFMKKNSIWDRQQSINAMMHGSNDRLRLAILRRQLYRAKRKGAWVVAIDLYRVAIGRGLIDEEILFEVLNIVLKYFPSATQKAYWGKDRRTFRVHLVHARKALVEFVNHALSSKRFPSAAETRLLESSCFVTRVETFEAMVRSMAKMGVYSDFERFVRLRRIVSMRGLTLSNQLLQGVARPWCGSLVGSALAQAVCKEAYTYGDTV